jgi:hypothetical protein
MTRRSTPDLITPTSAVTLLSGSYPSFSAAAARLTKAMRDGEVRVWCNCREVPRHYVVSSLSVVVSTDQDGRPRADIGTTDHWASDAVYIFAFDADEVQALMPSPLSPTVQLVVDAMVATFPPFGDPGRMREAVILRRLLDERGLWIGDQDPERSDPRIRDKAARSTYLLARRHIRRFSRAQF